MIRRLSYPKNSISRWIFPLFAVLGTLLCICGMVTSIISPSPEQPRHTILSGSLIALVFIVISALLLFGWMRINFQNEVSRYKSKLTLIIILAVPILLMMPDTSFRHTILRDDILVYGLLSITLIILGILSFLSTWYTEVALDGNVLILTGYQSQICVPVSNIADVQDISFLKQKGWGWKPPTLVKLMFHEPTVFGRYVKFWTPWQRWKPGEIEHPVISDLRVLSPSAISRQQYRNRFPFSSSVPANSAIDADE